VSRSTRRTAFGSLAVVLCLAVAGCGDDEPSDPTVSSNPTVTTSSSSSIPGQTSSSTSMGITTLPGTPSSLQPGVNQPSNENGSETDGGVVEQSQTTSTI
jgi:hypothetical protein